jgi:hypothetical protein
MNKIADENRRFFSESVIIFNYSYFSDSFTKNIQLLLPHLWIFLSWNYAQDLQSFLTKKKPVPTNPAINSNNFIYIAVNGNVFKPSDKIQKYSYKSKKDEHIRIENAFQSFAPISTNFCAISWKWFKRKMY